jgi:hypothetical protein
VFYWELESVAATAAAPEARIRVSAGLLWSQRHNPGWLEVRTLVGVFRRSEFDHSVWETEDRQWTAALRRAEHGDHVYLAVWRGRELVGTYDGARGWRAGTDRTRVRRKPTLARQLAFAS